MSISSYASLRSTTPGVAFNVAPGGSLPSDALWFSVQGLNRVGRNLLSDPVQLTWSAGQKIVITISPDAIASGEDIYEFIISAAPTNSPQQMKRLLAWRTRHPLMFDGYIYPGQGAYKVLPQTIELTIDEQVWIAPTVATPAALPTANLLYGMVRQISSTAEVVRYDDLATEGLYPAPVGYWISDSLSDISTYLADTFNPGGCDRLLINVDGSLIYPPPSYSGQGSDSHPIVLWYSNGIAETSAPVEPKGTGLALQFFANGRNFNAAFSGRSLLRLLGYVRRSTGILDTHVPTSGSSQVWSEGEAIELPVDLAAGYAAAYELVFRFRLGEIQALPPGAEISTLLFAEGLLGKLDSSWAIVGDVVLPYGEKLRILPSLGGVRRLGGSCLIRGYRSPVVGEIELVGLPANQPHLRVTISAALAGAIALRLPADSLNQTEAVRAIIATAGGTFSASSPIGVEVLDMTEAIELTIDYPTTIRANYPDRISGATAEFNVPLFQVFVQFDGVIYQLAAIVPNPPRQTITIATLAGATPVDALPINTDVSFCLFGYGNISATSVSVAPAGSDLAAGNYQVAIAYHFPDDGTVVTAISHRESDGCIPEFIPLQDAIAQSSTILAGSTPPMGSVGNESDIYLEGAGDSLNIYRKDSPEIWTLFSTVQASPGTPGTAGTSAYTMTTTAYGQPAVNAAVSLHVANSAWLAVGAIVFVETGGTYEVTAIGSPTTLTLNNLGYAGNADAGLTIPAGSKITPAGMQGATGATGTAGDAVSANGLMLGHVTNLVGTSLGQSWLHVDSATQHLRLRRQSNGAIAKVALTTEQNNFVKTQAVQPIALAPAGTLTIDGSASNCFAIAVTEPLLIDSPVNLVDGALYEFLIQQAGAGNYAVSFGKLWRWEADTVPDLATIAGRIWKIRAACDQGKLYADVKGWYTTGLKPFAYWSFDSAPYLDSVHGWEFNYADTTSIVSPDGNALMFGRNSSAYIELYDGNQLFGVVPYRVEFYLEITSIIGSGWGNNTFLYAGLEWRLDYLEDSQVLRLLALDDSIDIYGVEIPSTQVIALNTRYLVRIEIESGVQASIAVGTVYNSAAIGAIPEPSRSGMSFFAANTSGILFSIDELKIFK